MRARAVAAVVAAAFGVVAGACGSGGEPARRTATPTSRSDVQQRVVIDTFQFQPKVLRVRTGDTVEWTNRDAIVHTVTFGSREYAPGDGGRVTATHKDGTFDMPLDGKGATTRFTFTAPGTFHYFCDRHPGMEADVEVD